MFLKQSKTDNPSNQIIQSTTYHYQHQIQQCQQCGLKFNTLSQLLNHKKKFCKSSGYDDLTGLLLKQTRGNHIKPNANHGPQTSKKDQNKIRNYGEYSLNKIKCLPILNISQATMPLSLPLYDDIMNLEKHKRSIEGVRPYDANYKHSPNYKKKSENNQFMSARKFSNATHNSKSASAFSYKLNEQNFEKQSSNLQCLEKLLLENQDQTRSQRKQAYDSNQQLVQHKANQNLIHYQSNHASFQFSQQIKRPSLLNKSNASIANMPIEQKITYAKHKLDELGQIKSLYLKNGGQSKQFKQNTEKMVLFYEKFLEDCQNNNLDSSKFSIASRPQTPIQKLNLLSNDKQNKKIKNQIKKTNKNIDQNYQHQRKHGSNFQEAIDNRLKQTNPPHFNQITHHNPNPQPNTAVTQNYAHLYQIKVMEDMLRSRSQQNKKLIKALIKGLAPSYLEQSVSPKTQEQQERFRFANEGNTALASEDRILKLLQEEQLDQMALISKLPVGLQDQKLLSLVKNSELRFKMEKEALKQKLERMSWKDKMQGLQEERQLKNNDWVGDKNKNIAKNQINQYLEDFQHQFRV